MDTVSKKACRGAGRNALGADKHVPRTVDRADLAMHPRAPAPEGAPRSAADLPLASKCICRSLPSWAQPCSPCSWHGRRASDPMPRFSR